MAPADSNMASEEHVKEFKSQGFMVIQNFLTSEEVDIVKQECARIVEQMNPSEHCSVFQTGKNQVGDDYFLNSGDKISFFFEKDAVDSNGELIVDKKNGLNKIGHALHWWNPIFKKITFSQKVKELLRSLGYQDPVVIQSMYIFKNPGIGGEVVPHQDSTFLYTEPPSALGLWIPLEDVTLENGCLWFYPRSQNGEIHQRFTRNPSKEPLLILTGSLPENDSSHYVPLPVKKGDCVVIHGAILHKSEKNMSDKPRPVYTFHVVEQNDTVYSSENWLQPTAKLPFPSVYSTKD